MSPKSTRLLLAGAGVMMCAVWALSVAYSADLGGHTLATSGDAKTRNCSEAKQGQTCVPNQGPLMLTEYLACSLEAETRVFNQPEAFACVEAYLAVKLSFVAGVELEIYRQMPLQEQIEINLRAYEAFSDWRDENPHLAKPTMMNDV